MPEEIKREVRTGMMPPGSSSRHLDDGNMTSFLSNKVAFENDSIGRRSSDIAPSEEETISE